MNKTDAELQIEAARNGLEFDDVIHTDPGKMAIDNPDIPLVILYAILNKTPEVAENASR